MVEVLAAEGSRLSARRILVLGLLASSTLVSAQTLKHIVIIVKENRSFDSYFGQFPGVTPGLNPAALPCVGTQGGCTNGSLPVIPGNPTGEDVSCGHGWQDALASFDIGAMDKFNQRCSGASDWAKEYGQLCSGSSSAATNGQYCPTVGASCGTGGTCQQTLPFYWPMASSYGLADHMFSSAMGPSYPNHLYIIAATSNEAANNPLLASNGSNSWTCDSGHTGNGSLNGSCNGGTNAGASCTLDSQCPGSYCTNGNVYSGTFVGVDLLSLNPTGNWMYPGVCSTHRNIGCNGVCSYGPGPTGVNPCPQASASTDDPICTAIGDTCDVTSEQFLSAARGSACPNVTTIADELDAARVSWGMYYSTTGNSTKISQQWNPVGYVQHLRYGNDWTNSVHPEGQFVTDAASCTSDTSCNLPAVSWVVPDASVSEHPPNEVQPGEQWTQTQVDALLNNPYLWTNTALFVTWDDHGGFYDHLPPTLDAFSWTNGMRVPLLCIGKYCLNQVTTTTFTFASFLKCIENTFGVSYLISSVDGAANDVCFSPGGMMSPNQNNPFPGGLTSTTIVSSLNPSVFGQSVTFTATVTPKTSGSPTGTVTFSYGSMPLGTVPLTAGTAMLTTTAVPGGNQTITATYSGDAYFSGSSASLTQAVNLASTNLTLTTSTNPSGYNQQVTFTATIASQYGGQASGSVNFTDGKALLGTVTVNGNVASLSTANLAPGAHSITASYSGDSNFMVSSGSVNQTVNQAGTSTTLASGVNPSQISEPVVFTASVTPQYGGQVTGTVTFKDGSTPIGTSPVSGNVASINITNFSLATHSITATYSGDTNFLSSVSNVISQVVTLDSTTTTLASSSNPSVSGKSVTFTADVISGWNPPTGKVEFLDGSTVLATTTVKSGVGTYSTSKLSTGTNIITAVYLGDSNNNGSSSPSLSQFVLAATTTALSSSPNPSVYQEPVMLTATVTSSLGPPPNGELITFTQGSTTLGTAPLSGGVSTFSYSGLAVGTKSIKASYPGDSIFANSTSPGDSQVINKASTTTMLTSSLNPSTYGQTVTFTATVSPQFAGTPGGTVEFDDGTTKLKTVTLSNGVASYTTSSLSQGSHTINAAYNGNSSFTPSSSSLVQTVQ